MTPSPLALALLSACSGDDPAPPSAVGEGLFAEGCPSPGRALARRIGVDASLPGPDAVGTRGDLLLANDVAAFVITEPDKGSTYYYYGGVVADAVAMDGCAPATDDGLDEIALVLGHLDLAAFDASTLRGFRGKTASVVSDGSDGGPAVVRVEGFDDTHWLVEGELLRSAIESMGGKQKSAPYGLELVVDYELFPGDPVLHVRWTLKNPGDQQLELLTAQLLSLAPAYDVSATGSARLDFDGVSLTAGMPHVAATSGEGAYAFTVVDGNLGYTGIAGIDVSLDLDQALTEPIVLVPGGEQTRETLFAVGPTDGPSATGALWKGRASEVGGRVLDPDGEPVEGVWVDLLGDGGTGFGVVDRARTDADGRFSHWLPELDQAWLWQLQARGAGRDQGRAVDAGPDARLEVGAAGSVEVAVTEDGEPAPARIALVRDDGATATLWTAGTSTEPLAPGHWTYTVTRGFLDEPVTGELTVDGAGARLEARLSRALDHAGWRSIDTHVHSAHSPDSRMDPPEQTRHAAAHGVDVVVHSEHEHLVDELDNAERAGVDGWVSSVLGQEVTATIPEHMTMFPVVPDGTPRGGFVQWWGMDIGQVFGAIADRSDGGIRILNHPGYMDLIGWDPVTATWSLDDPTVLGLAPDADLWSWDFEAIEVMNGLDSPFSSGNHRFELWQSLLNAGHRVAPVGCSDDHGGFDVGYPRTWFAGDDPEAAFRAGRTMPTMGAFARVEVDGKGPGELVGRSGTVPLRVEITAPSAVDVTHAVVFANCDLVAKLPATDPHGVVKLATTVDVDVASDAQLVVAAFGAEPLPAGLPQGLPAELPRVLTNAVFVDADGDGTFDAPGGRTCAYDLSAP